MAPRVLIVEDEARIAGLIAKNLEAAGLDCVIAPDGLQGLDLFRKGPFDLIVLDLMLPGIDGLDVCRRIRETSRVPILIVTARRGESDIVLGLEVGADDYIVKPFGVRELVARARALLRRGLATSEDAPVRVGGFTIDPARRRVEREGVEIDLTTLEFDLLYFVAARPGRVFSRDQLLEQVWGKDRWIDARSIDSLISRLRHKIEPDQARPRYLQTVWGAGYRFAESPLPEGA
jgi:two-component system, OmpR family, response regulator MtrA